MIVVSPMLFEQDVARLWDSRRSVSEGMDGTTASTKKTAIKWDAVSTPRHTLFDVAVKDGTMEGRWGWYFFYYWWFVGIRACHYCLQLRLAGGIVVEWW